MITDEQRVKEYKRNKKLLKNSEKILENTRIIAYLLIAIVLLVVFIPLVEASLTRPNNTQIYFLGDYTMPVTVTVTAAQVETACQYSYGVGRQADTTYFFTQYNDLWQQQQAQAPLMGTSVTSQNSNYKNIIVHSRCAGNNNIEMYLFANSSIPSPHLIVLPTTTNTTNTTVAYSVNSDTSLDLIWDWGDGNINLIQNGSTIAAHKYSVSGLYTVGMRNNLGSLHPRIVYNTTSVYGNNLSVNFNAVPSSGNNSVLVTFTPFVTGNNLDHITWDYGWQGLSPETKYTGMNDTFQKNYTTAGHYIVRLFAYDTLGNSVSASKNINVYNYTLGITPTPTLTPTPTPTPQTNTTGYIKIIVKDQYNFTQLTDVSIGLRDVDDIGAGWFNVTAANGEYTFNGYGSGGNTPFVVGHHYMTTLSKTGYVTLNTGQQWDYTGAPTERTEYLMPSAYTPTASNFVLYIPMYDSTTNQLISGSSGTVTLSNQSSIWTSVISNPSGAVTYPGLTPSASYKIDIVLNGYKQYTGYFASSSSMAGTTQNYIAYLEPTNMLPSAFTLSVTPSTGTLNDTYTMSLTGDISTANAISYRYFTEQSAAVSFVATSGYTQYQKITGAWKGWDGSSFTVATSNPASVTGKVQSASNPNVDTLTVIAYITVNGNVYQAEDTVDIVTTGKTPKIIVAYDMSGYGGASAATKHDFTSHILDVYSNVWVNTTYNIDTYPGYFYITPNTLYLYYASATGYYDTAPQSKVFTGQTGEGGIEYRLYKVNPAIDPLNNATLYAHVRNGEQKNIQGARVSFNDGKNCFTDSAGSCGREAYVGATYTASASAYGYSVGSGSITVANNTSNVIEILLIKSTGNTSVTVAPISTIRTIPTYSNTSGFNNTPAFTEYECSLDTSDMGIFDLLMNNIACAGVKGADKQGLVLAALMMFVFAMGLSNKGKSAGGALAGVIIGTIISVGMNLIPFWILIITITICGIAFAALITKSSGGQ